VAATLGADCEVEVDDAAFDLMANSHDPAADRAMERARSHRDEDDVG
jgi:hypothetical protein